ncbi:cation transporter [candidate division TA06 bacterium]|uniref:Cation transporter n=1 Tax=candidate division TA06 bacterium TaxID=2250710 RepID=A0A933IB55_UNCT6|nr:cation transporter [candidate division TA06 bacterium]
MVSIVLGTSDESISLLGFGLDSFIEVFSAVIILWRLRREFGNGAGAVERERLATRGIGILFVLLTAVIVITSVLRLVNHVHPETALPGIVVSLASLSFMFWLDASKMRAAKALDSQALKSDAVCSLACIWLSVVLLIGSGIYYLTRIWWADTAAAIIIALLILREGSENLRASFQKEFDGCCCGR